MTPPLVSIIITNYNYGCYLSKAIDSALSQTYPHTEVVVVDDGSTDNSKEIITSYIEQIVSVFKQNGGQASAFNKGFEVSKGDIICFLDSDDIFTPIKVAEVVKVFKEHQDIGWCFHHLHLVHTNSSDNSIVEANVDDSSFKIDEIDFITSIKNAKLPTFVPPTSGLCFSRSLLSQILPMPEAEGVSISDLYIKYIALALGKGCVIDRKLSIQGIHNNNAYTCKNTIKKQKLYAHIDILTSYWMRSKFPALAKLANKLIARGIGSSLRTGGIETNYKNPVYDYLSNVSLTEKLVVIFNTTYYWIKFWLRPS
jgi:glycosyltransferase involved in cell wall biosynthesis